jgi:hypothetical protein
MYNLRKKEESKRFLDEITKVYKGQSVPSRIFTIDDNIIQFEYNYKKDEDILKIKLINKDKTKKCLDIDFFNSKKNTIYVAFDNSYIHGINSGLCGLNKKQKKIKKLKGGDILQIIDKLNKLLLVKESTLLDDSRIELCNSNISLKTLSVFKYGKTWYDKNGGFVPTNDNFYRYFTEMNGLTIGELIDYIQNNDKHITEFRIPENRMNNFNKLLQKNKINKNESIKDAILKFYGDIEGDNCEKYDMWEFLFIHMPRRRDIDDKKINAFFKVMDNTFRMTESVKYY